MQRPHGMFVCGGAICDDDAISIKCRAARVAGAQVAHGALIRWRFRQLLCDCRGTVNLCLAPDQPFHSLLRLYPWAACLTPARRAEDRHFQTQPLCFLGGMTHGVVPLRRAEVDLLFDGLTTT